MTKASHTNWAIMDPIRGRVTLAMTLSALSGLASLSTLGLLSLAVVRLIEISHAIPIMPMVGAVASTITAYLLRLAAFDQSHYAAFRLEAVLRNRLINHVSTLSLGTVQDFGTSALAKVIHDDVKAMHVFVADSTPLYARAFVMPIMTFGLLIWLDWRLAAAALGVVLFGFAVMALAMRNFPDMARLYNDARERVSASVIEFVQAMPVVRAFDTGHTTFGRYQRALDDYLEIVVAWYRSAGFTARFSMAILSPLPTLIVLLSLGLWLFSGGDLAFGPWFAVLMIGAGMAEAMMPMMSLNHLADKAKISIARIQEVMDLPSMPAVDVAEKPQGAGVIFDNVVFGYGEGDMALRGISFDAAPGTLTALVGPSGAGKTTVAQLIARFWDVGEGSVSIGGVDVRQMDAETLARQVALVFQDTFLFSGSIADNIRLGSPHASLDAVVRAARAAQAHEFISALPEGYDTRAGERGHFLSGGQKQRITIARAILQDRPIVILDEATSFSDSENEAAILAALKALMHGRTVIMVAHRLSTIRHAERILVFDRGRIVESGTHESLLEVGGLYARQWTSQNRAQNWTLKTSGGANHDELD